MRVRLDKGQFGWDYILTAENGKDYYVQTDNDYPGIAAHFGFVPCEHCQNTDGTIDCAHHSAMDMISAAHDYLNDHIGESFEDPGYFGD